MSEKNQTNNISVVSLAVGILSLLIPFIGLILGIIGIVFSRKAVKQINKTNENGRGLATAGFICSIVGIIIQLFAVLGYVAFFSVSRQNADAPMGSGEGFLSGFCGKERRPFL